MRTTALLFFGSESRCFVLPESPDAFGHFAELRAMYEPWARALSRHLLMPLPPGVPPAGAPENWQRLEGTMSEEL
ncbi:MAG TPA: hypothetical protein VGB47_07500 [Thermoanaerobaculia bacterium]